MSWVPVAKKEFLENVRNAWVIAVSVIFLLLVLAASGFASAVSSMGREFDFADIVSTLNAMENVAGFLVPILAIMLGFSTIAGERESGSLALLVSQPVTRWDVVFGKAVGLWGVLATAILVGIGGGGLIVLSQSAGGGDASAGFAALMVFLLATLAWGAAWVSITVLLSAFFKRRGTTIGGAVSVWFLFSSFVWTALTLLILSIGLRNGSISEFVQRGPTELPGWVILTQVLNPNRAYDGILATSIDGYETFTSSIAKEVLPDLYVPLTFVVAMIAWIVLPFLGAYGLFRSRDI